ncbi:Pyridoxine 5'-phosphate synthase [hydrothermal vent metagenome]|uniref:Pyridoxine 5'-phosphate synthase n=1 Tax=hydrothermal vent metagenome TaxID=652676 RepID=A0A3B1AJE5_9ZZZZ
MTKLSVNLNKIALLRNSRGRDFPNVVSFAEKFIALGVHGITVHPRQDERHITIKDTIALGKLLASNNRVEYNIEGYPSEEFLKLVEETQPDQCTLVPDSPEQLTSDHGWDLEQHSVFVKNVCSRLLRAGVRTSLFLDPDIKQVKRVKATGAERIELYTETYASAFSHQKDKNFTQLLEHYNQAAITAQNEGLGVNAGHDLDLHNLPDFLTINNILEVSIGHVLLVECIEQGMANTIKSYLEICDKA